MKTGFYDLSKLSTAKLKKFYKDAIMLSYDTHVDILDCNTSWRRMRTSEKSIQDMLNIVDKKWHNVCIDRTVQFSQSDREGEIGFCLLTNPDYFLYIFVTLENLKILTEKYQLEMK